MARTNPYGLKVDLDTENGSVNVLVRKREGEGFADVDTGSFALENVHESLQANVALYGLSKLLQDRTSQVDAGPSKLDAMGEVMALLEKGEWEKERTAGAPTVSAEVEALAEIKGVSVAVIQKAIRNYTAEQRTKILASPSVVARAATIKATREADTASVSLDDLAE